MDELTRASFELRLEDVASAVRGGADPKALNAALVSACSAHDAPAARQVRLIRLLIESGANVDAADKNGVTALHRAVRFRNAAAVKELITHGANVNATDRKSGSTPLHRAVTSSGPPATKGKGNVAIEIARILLENGASPAAENKLGRTPLGSARNVTMKTLLRGVA